MTTGKTATFTGAFSNNTTITFPDNSGTVAELNATNYFTANQGFASLIYSSASIEVQDGAFSHLSCGSNTVSSYRAQNSTSGLVPQLCMSGTTGTQGGAGSGMFIDVSNNNGLLYTIGNGTRQIMLWSINGTGTTNTAGQEAGGIGIYTKGGASAAALRVNWDSTGACRMTKYGVGTATFDASGNITSASDIRLKTNIKDYKTGLSELMNIQPISFKWRKESGNETDSTYAGFSAQNVKANIPYGTGVNTDGYLSLVDRAILASCVNAIKELKKENDLLKSEIRKLKK
jgi:hypothetical protein